MKSNKTQDKTRQRQFLWGDIFACKPREAIIYILTERAAPLRHSLNRADVEKVLPRADLAPLRQYQRSQRLAKVCPRSR